jgi:hypothetical protein
MKAVIESPSFYGAEDENVFFNCIYSLPNFVKVTGRGAELHIEFKTDITDEVVEQLLVICRRWFIGIESLIEFKNSINEDFPLWYQGVE